MSISIMDYKGYEETLKEIDDIENGDDCSAEVTYITRGGSRIDLNCTNYDYEGTTDDGYEVYRKPNGERVEVRLSILRAVHDTCGASVSCYGYPVYPTL